MLLISCQHLEMNGPTCLNRTPQSPELHQTLEPGFVGPEACVIWGDLTKKNKILGYLGGSVG